ncbi:MAG: tryptophan-rich sensory protein [Planctomycetes bacterium]|nr:tryptophan-rich sensory protein [Planctomycetota bacterium]
MANATHENSPNYVRSVLGLAGWIALCFAASVGGVFFAPAEWYDRLEKPAFNPPAWVFGPVWTLLYIAMGTSAWLVWRSGGFGKARLALGLFLLQLLLNAAWTPIFFGLQAPGAALLVIIALCLAILSTALAFRRHSRPAAGLLLPYLLWVSFASVLNAALWYLNS